MSGAGKDSASWNADFPRLLQISCRIGFVGAGTMPDSGDLFRQEKVGGFSACYIIVNSFLRGTMCRMMMWVAAETDLVICRLKWERRRCGREAWCA